MKKIKKLIVLTLAVGMLATSVLGTSAAFDPVYYAKQNPDVVKVLGDSPEMLKLHYDLFGRKELRMSNVNDVEPRLRILFKADEYAKLFPDVQNAFGDDEEAMFQHYVAFGLLEGRRPSEEVSQAVADSLKKSVEKAMTDAKIEAKPGSAELVKVIKGEIQTSVTTTNAAEAALQTALIKVQEVVAKAVTDTVQEVRVPKPSGDSSSSGSSFVPPEVKGKKVTTFGELKTAISDLSGNKTTGGGDNAGGNNILVMNNIPMTESIEINGNVNLYLNQCTLTGSADKTFTIKEDVSVTVGSLGGQSKIVNTKTDAGGSIFYMTGGTLQVMGGVTLDGGNNACAVKIAAGDGNSTGNVKASVTVFGSLKGKHGICIDENVKKDDSTSKNVEVKTYMSDIFGKESGICLKGYGEVILGYSSNSGEGGVVTGDRAGIEIHAGELVVNDVKAGTNSTATSDSETAAALVVSPNTDNDKAQKIKVTINGGIFGAKNGGVPLYVKGGSGGSTNVTVTIPNNSTAVFIAKDDNTKAIQLDNGATVTDNRSADVKAKDKGTRDSDSQGNQSNPSGDSGQNGASGG